MRTSIITAVIFIFAGALSATMQPIVHPFEKKAGHAPAGQIDRLVGEVQHKLGIESANVCSDAVFVRRVFLDVIGTLPRQEEVLQFLESTRKNKREVLIDTLLDRSEFADYWSLKWCDLLRVKSEFPINLWPNAVQAYHGWIREAIANHMPYDTFVRELLTSSGSNFRVPPVNFYRAMQNHEPPTIASAVALTFMGTRIEKWPEDRRLEMEKFFSRVAYKKTAEWKEEIVYNDPSPTERLHVRFPDGTTAEIQPSEDPRKAFADWLITSKNTWFSQNVVNRIWAWLGGRGIIHEPDDVHANNLPVNPKLLRYLEKELVKSHYDLRHIYRLILNSQTYQQSAIPRSTHAKASALFGYYTVRPLEAEVLIDAIGQICGPEEDYQSEIPEPFTFIPRIQRTIALSDGSITSPFLEMFGRPARDTGLASERNEQPTKAQRLHLLNSTQIQRKIERGANVRKYMKATKGNSHQVVDTIFLSILSRYPTRTEFAIVENYVKTSSGNAREVANDLIWALINSKEFLYKH